MKKGIVSIFIIGSLLMLMIFISLGIYLNKKDKTRQEEGDWYVKNLKYEFCCEITSMDRIRDRKGDFSKIRCRLGDDFQIDTSIEDSLQALLKYHNSLRFILSDINYYEVVFVIQGGSRYHKNDMVCINSDDNTLFIFRDGVRKSTQELSFCLTGE